MASTRVFRNGRWVDVPDRPNGVLDSIRRNNGGKTIAEMTASTDKSFMPYDKRYPGAFDFLLDSRWQPSRDRRKAAVDALESAGGSATLTKKGATGMVIKGAPQSPMAGARDTRGLAWDVIRAGIHERATDNVLDDRWMGDKAPKVDMASEESRKNVLGQFDKAVAAEKDQLAGQFVDNLTESLKQKIETEHKPSGPKPSEASEDASVLHDIAVSTGDTGLMKETFRNWEESVGAGQPKETVTIKGAGEGGTNSVHTVGKDTAEWVNKTEKSFDNTQKFIDDMRKQMGLTGTVKGGSSRDRGDLDSLIKEMEG